MTRAGSSTCSNRRRICECCAVSRSCGKASSAVSTAVVCTVSSQRFNSTARAPQISQRSRWNGRCPLMIASTSARSERCPWRNNTSTSRMAVFLRRRNSSCRCSKQTSQPADCAEQVNAHRRFVQARSLTDLPRRLAFEVAQHEHEPLPLRKRGQSRKQLPASLARKHVLFRPRRARRQVVGRVALGACGIENRRGNPTLTPPSCLQPVQAPIDQDAREPNLKGQFLTETAEMHVGFDESILHCFVGVRRVPQVVERDTNSPPLVARHDFRKFLAGFLEAAGRLQGLHIHRDPGVSVPGAHGGGCVYCHSYVTNSEAFTLSLRES